MAKKPIKITEVVLRDAHQSLLATRMTMDEMRPILPEMDKIPYFSVECWGGASLRIYTLFLSESLDLIKDTADVKQRARHPCLAPALLPILLLLCCIPACKRATH